MNLKDFFMFLTSWEYRTKKRFDFLSSLDEDTIRENTIKELYQVIPSISKGLNLTLVLLIIAFCTGFCLLIFTLFIVFNDNVETVIKVLFGSAGIINTIGFLFFYPIEKIQLTKARQAVYQAVYATWISDLLMYEGIISDMQKKGEIDIDEFIKLRESTAKLVTDLLIIINPKSDLTKLSSLISLKKEPEPETKDKE